MQLEKLKDLYLRINCIGFYIFLFFLLEGAWAFYRLYHPLSLQPLYTKLLCLSVDSSVIPTEEPQYIMEDELSPPKSSHKEELNLNFVPAIRTTYTGYGSRKFNFSINIAINYSPM